MQQQTPTQGLSTGIPRTLIILCRRWCHWRGGEGKWPKETFDISLFRFSFFFFFIVCTSSGHRPIINRAHFYLHRLQNAAVKCSATFYLFYSLKSDIFNLKEQVERTVLKTSSAHFYFQIFFRLHLFNSFVLDCHYQTVVFYQIKKKAISALYFSSWRTCSLNFSIGISHWKTPTLTCSASSMRSCTNTWSFHYRNHSF